MKLYLSSYRLGYKAERLTQLLKPVNGVKKVAFIDNALDAEGNYIRVLHSTNRDITDLNEASISSEKLDLKDYFGKSKKLKEKLKEFSGVYVRGGNVFVLRQAFAHSGFDKIVTEYSKSNPDFVYAGYSAGVCVLTKTLNGLEIVDNIKHQPEEYPRRLKDEELFKGLGLLDFSVAPHFRSDHPESQAINKVIDYFLENKILFIVLRDGEVILLDTQSMGKQENPFEILKTTGT
jgi:dipeptidase E